MKTVFVSGCFDLLHSGHIAFLKEAASYGRLIVGIGSDETVRRLKGRFPVFSQEERRYLLKAVRYIDDCVINSGEGVLDFENELRSIRPDVFIVNQDGHSPAKEALVTGMGIEYKVLKRIPDAGLPARSTTAVRAECRIPYRIDLAGGWLDQPFVSKHFHGPVLTISIEPTIEFNERSGMATSTRRRAQELWQTRIPEGDPEQLARILFCYENPPGTSVFSGSQDSLGIVLPGLNRLDYSGDYWPEKITTVQDEETLVWIENHLHLLMLGPREENFNVLENTRIDKDGAKRLAGAADGCWQAILNQDLPAFGTHFRKSFEAQTAMFPNMMTASIRKTLDEFRNNTLGWKLSGAGGGGYLIFVSDQMLPKMQRIRIRRKSV